MQPKTYMQWSESLSPEHSYIYAQNDIDIPAPAEQVWETLLRIEDWPKWYSNCAWTRPETPELAKGTKFTWKTFGVVVKSEVVVFEPPYHIEWNAKGTGIRAYHGWHIEDNGQQCHVITEEAQGGFLAWLSKILFPHRLWQGHQLWVESLKQEVLSQQQ